MLDQTLVAGLITFKKIELCIFFTVLFTAISASLYTWSIEFLTYIAKSHITHVPSLLLVYTIPCLVTAHCLTMIMARSLSSCEECFQPLPNIARLFVF